MDGIKVTFALSVALAGVTVLIACGAKWRRVGIVMPGGPAPDTEGKGDGEGGQEREEERGKGEEKA